MREQTKTEWVKAEIRRMVGDAVSYMVQVGGKLERVVELESDREIARRLGGVDRTTVQRARQELEAEGAIGGAVEVWRRPQE